METKSGIFDAAITVKDLGDGDKGHGEFEAVLSVPTVDRDGEVIDIKAFDPLPTDGIVIHKDHIMSVDSAVAWAQVSYEGDRLIARGYFGSDPESQIMRRKVNEGIVRTMSVGFMNAARKSVDGTPHITKGELLESSFVSVPSNRQAVVLSAKSAVAAVEAGQARAYKRLAGSHEERADQIRDAIQANHPDAWWVTVLATFDDTVVYQVDDDTDTFQASYMLSDGALSLEAGVPVEVAEVLAPAKSAPDPENTAAPAAVSPADVAVRIAVARAQADAASVL